MNKKLFLVVRRIISTAAIILLSIIIVASALTFQLGVYGADNPKILVVQHSEQRFWFADTGLNQLGIPHDPIKISDLLNTDITKYRIIIFGSQIGRLEEVKPYVDAKAPEIESWITKGGCLAIFSQYVHAAVWDLPNYQLSMDQGSGYYKWLPGEPDFVSAASDTVHITNNTHPITKNFTDYDLSFWDSSADGYFTNPPGETIAVQTGQAGPYFPYLQPNAQNDHCVLYVQELGAGKVVASSLDADYHCLLYNGHANCNKQGAKNLFKAIINMEEYFNRNLALTAILALIGMMVPALTRAGLMNPNYEWVFWTFTMITMKKYMLTQSDVYQSENSLDTDEDEDSESIAPEITEKDNIK